MNCWSWGSWWNAHTPAQRAKTVEVTAVRRHVLIRSSPLCDFQPRLRFRPAGVPPATLELHPQARPDRAPLLEHARVVHGEPVFLAVTVLVLGQERAPGPPGLGVIDVVGLRIERRLGPDGGLEVADVRGVEKVGPLHVQGQILSPRPEEAL